MPPGSAGRDQHHPAAIDPEGQAAAILEESDERVETRSAAADDRTVERRTSDEVTEPPA